MKTWNGHSKTTRELHGVCSISYIVRRISPRIEVSFPNNVDARDYYFMYTKDRKDEHKYTRER